MTNGNYGSPESGECFKESIADYWGKSQTTSCGVIDGYDEWEDEYYEMFHWGLMPFIETQGLQRTTNEVSIYDPNGGIPKSTTECYEIMQHMSTALFRIFNDIGKYKCDLLVLESMPLLDFSIVSLQNASEVIYQTALDLYQSNYIDDNDLCIIYKNLDEKLMLGQVWNGPLPSSVGDAYMKDTPCDYGVEPNPDSGPMWNSRDIWVRHDDDLGESHQNPEYKTSSPNWVYARVRSRGCSYVQDAVLKLYWSKASTGLTWPTHWNNYYLPSTNILAGDFIGSVNISIPASDAGGEYIYKIPWYPPNPADFPSEDHHFCLLARIDNSQFDPISFPEGSNVNSNVRQNNNLVWRNVSVLDEFDDITSPVSVFLGCDISAQGGSIEMQPCRNLLDKTIQQMGTVYVTLDSVLYEDWIQNGAQGSNYIIVEEGKLSTSTSGNMLLEGLTISSCTSMIHVEFDPLQEDRLSGFNLIQRSSNEIVIGGETFIFDPTQINSVPQPIPINNEANIFLDENLKSPLEIRPDQILLNVECISLQGHMMFSRSTLDYQGVIDMLSGKPSGVYILKYQDTDGHPTTLKIFH